MRRFTLLHVLGLMLAAGIFLLDLMVTQGIAVPVLYTVLVLLSLRQPGERLTWLAALSTTALTTIGAFLPDSMGAKLGNVAANRLLSLLVIWTTAALCIAHKRNLARIERERRTAERAEELANLGEMAAGIAHELATPIAALQGRVEMLEHSLESPPLDAGELRRAVRILASLGERMARLVRTVRSLGRNSSGDPFEPVTVERVVRDALALVEERLRRNDVEVRLGPLAGAVRIEGREAQLEQVLLNLIGNAADAVRELPERWMRLDVRETRETVEISVTDSGNGIPGAIRDRIMAPFFTTKPVGEGTGLGLSISRAIVESHAGRLSVDSDSPHTRFVISLPKRQPQSPRT